MRTDELDYVLPERLIAQFPKERRDQSRLLVLDRRARTMREDLFANLPTYLLPGDCVVLNDTKVIRARLSAHKPTGGRVEIFLLKERGPGEWEALIRPGSRVKAGAQLILDSNSDAPITATIVDVLSDGRRVVRFDRDDVMSVLEQSGAVPLPPYIRRDAADTADAGRYQTIYANTPGAVAAPTAGLHFTPKVFAALDIKQVSTAKLTLHVGYGTFKPIQTDEVSEHKVDSEQFSFPDEAAAQLNATRAQGGRICAVGTTVTRVLETQIRDGRFIAGVGETNCYIYPPYTFRGVDALITNFHLPRSSLLALVCAFGGTEFVLEAYGRAVEQEFRFYSYGDAMLIL